MFYYCGFLCKMPIIDNSYPTDKQVNDNFAFGVKTCVQTLLYNISSLRNLWPSQSKQVDPNISSKTTCTCLMTDNSTSNLFIKM